MAAKAKKADIKRLYRIHEFVKDFTEVPYIIDNLIPYESKTILAGESGSGKSTLCIQLADAVMEGTAVLGKKCIKSNTLYIQTDTSTPIWKALCHRVVKDSYAWTVVNMPAHPLDDTNCIEFIKRIIEHTNPELLIFDSLNSLTSKDINSKIIMAVFHLITELCKVTKGEDVYYRSHIVIHHLNKDNSKRGINRFAGYHGIVSYMDNVFLLEQGGIAIEKGRTLADKYIPLEKDRQGKWQAVTTYSSSDVDNLAELEALTEKYGDMEIDI